MGDPRKFKSKYSGPGHPWQMARMEEERVVVKEFGLRTKRELWKASSKLKAFANQAKRLIALRTSQAELEGKQLIARVSRLGLLPSTAKLDDVLGLNVRDLLNRRLQTILVKRGLARTPHQARQFIIHEHVLIGDKKVSAPGYLVPVSEEPGIMFISNSSLANPEHPERALKPRATPKVEVVEARSERPKRSRKPRAEKPKAETKSVAAEARKPAAEGAK